jgi:hypothetical protein
MRSSLGSVLILATICTARAALADAGPTCGDAFDQSQVKRDEGKLLEARWLLRVCGGPTCSPTQQRLCSEWLTDVEARVPSFVLAARDGSGADRVDVKVTLDGVPVTTKLDGRAMDVDPGPHAFVFELADGTRAETNAVANERVKGAVVSVTLGKAPAVAESAGPPLSETRAIPGVRSGSRAVGTVAKTAGLSIGAVGVVGLALGTVFGVEEQSTKSSHCSSGVCDPGYASQAYSQATISTVALVAGGVLVAGGATLWLVAPKHRADGASVSLSAAPMVGLATGGLRVVGTW